MTADARALYLFGTMGGMPVALPSASVEAVIRLGAVEPIPRVPAGVTGLSAVRSRVLTVIDPCIIFDLPRNDPASGVAPLALVARVVGHNYAICVDAVADICQPEGPVHPLTSRGEGALDAIGQGHAQYDGRSHLVIDAADIVGAISLPHAA